MQTVEGNTWTKCPGFWAAPEQQVHAVQQIAARKAQKATDADIVDREVGRLMAAWTAAGHEARRLFLAQVT